MKATDIRKLLRANRGLAHLAAENAAADAAQAIVTHAPNKSTLMQLVSKHAGRVAAYDDCLSCLAELTEL